jgi:uncharacterized membrane protein YhaH (DUF805 family)
VNALSVAAIYIGMLVFDAIVLIGTVLLIKDYDWSAWWMLLAVIMCTGSNPKIALTALEWRNKNEQP